MSVTELPSEVPINENSEVIIDCPPGIQKQLKQAAFEQTKTDVFVKKRRSLNNENEYKVAEARLEGSQLSISVEDIVGVIDLTPSSRLQINPKIGWSEILDMFLTVHQYNRTLEYHGIPIEDFLSDDIDLEDIFVVVAANYLNSLQPLYRYGFLREFQTKHIDAVDSRGRIDIEKSLQNKTKGIPEQHYVQRIANYDIPVNRLIYRAGEHLIQLFRKSASEHSQKEYYRLFSELNDTVQDIRLMGIGSKTDSVFAYKNITTKQLPRQRRYYTEAMYVSKMILSSTTGNL